MTRLAMLSLIAALAVVTGGVGVAAALVLESDGDDEPTARAAAASVRLTLTASNGTSASSVAKLRCSGSRATGTGWARRSAKRRCSTARRLARFLAAKPRKDLQCTMIYGGPERARVSGKIGSRRIARTFTRRDGCQIAEFERVKALLSGSPAG